MWQQNLKDKPYLTSKEPSSFGSHLHCANIRQLFSNLEVWVFSIINQQVSQFTQEEHNRGRQLLIHTPQEFYLKDNAILPLSFIYLVNHLAIHCPSVLRGYGRRQSSKAFVIQSPFFLSGTLRSFCPTLNLYCPSDLFSLYSLDPFS